MDFYKLRRSVVLIWGTFWLGFPGESPGGGPRESPQSEFQDRVSRAPTKRDTAKWQRLEATATARVNGNGLPQSVGEAPG